MVFPFFLSKIQHERFEFIKLKLYPKPTLYYYDYVSDSKCYLLHSSGGPPMDCPGDVSGPISDGVERSHDTKTTIRDACTHVNVYMCVFLLTGTGHLSQPGTSHPLSASCCFLLLG